MGQTSHRRLLIGRRGLIPTLRRRPPLHPITRNHRTTPIPRRRPTHRQRTITRHHCGSSQRRDVFDGFAVGPVSVLVADAVGGQVVAGADPELVGPPGHRLEVGAAVRGGVVGDLRVQVVVAQIHIRSSSAPISAGSAVFDVVGVAGDGVAVVVRYGSVGRGLHYLVAGVVGPEGVRALPGDGEPSPHL